MWLKKEELMKITKICILTIALGLLSGCGFKISSQQFLPQQMQNMYVQSDSQYSRLAVLLRRELKNNGITLSQNAQNAPLTLYIANETFTYNKDSINSPSTQARIYYLTMSTTFYLKDQQGNNVLEPQAVNTTSTLTLNSNEIFATSTQTDLYKQNMRKILITKIFDLLSSKKVLEKLS